MITVTISEKGGQQSQYEFSSSPVAIGRMKGNDIVLPKGNVSKKHSRITFTANDFQIADLNSTNGTYVNGRKVTDPQPIGENDKIYIGDFILQVALAEASQPSSAPPSPPQQRPSNSGSAPQDPNQSGYGAGQDANQSGYGARRDSNAGPPSPPRDTAGNAQASSPIGGGGPVDDLFAAGDSDPSASQAGGPGTASPANANPAGGPEPSGAQRQPAAESALDLDNLDLGQTGDSPAQSAPQPRRQRPSPQPSDGGGHPRRRNAPRRAPASRGDEDRSVDAHGQGRAPGPAPGAFRQAREVRSEFDADFHAAQHDVARVLFESTDLDSLPLDYPPKSANQADFERRVEQAVDKVQPQVDRDALVGVITAECLGLGAVDQYLDDPQVRDIHVNQFDQILVRRQGEMIVAQRAFSHPDFLTIAAQRLLGTRDTSIGADEVRFSDGTRVHVVMPPLSADGPALTVRKPPTDHPSLDHLVDGGVLSAGMREFLDRAVHACQSILVAGPTSSGKSTMLGAIAAEIPEGTRVVTIEDSTHLDLPQRSVVRLEANPAAGFDMTYLVRTAVAMHPQRIIIDECRSGEAYEWVTSAASGTEGSMIASHGSGAADALGRLESLCLLGNPEISPRGLREQLARAIDLVVVVHRHGDNDFQVRQITEVQGVDLDAFRLNDVFYHRIEGSETHFHPTGYIPLFYEDLRHAGIDVDFDIFHD